MSYDKQQYTLADAADMSVAGSSRILDSKGYGKANLMVVATDNYSIEVTEDPSHAAWVTLDPATAGNVKAIATNTNTVLLSFDPPVRYTRLTWSAGAASTTITAFASLSQ